MLIFGSVLGSFSGYRIRAGSGSPPVRLRSVGHRFSHEFDNPGQPTRSRGYGGRRSPLPPRRYRDYSPSMRSRGRVENRFVGSRGFDGSGYNRGSYRGGGDDMVRNDPNLRRREGDWICHDPLCNNLNFARREHCNKCNKYRYSPRGVSPRRGFPGPPSPPRLPSRHLAAHPHPPDRSPIRPFNGHRSPRPYLREQPPPRDLLKSGGHHPPPPPSHRHETPRFLDHQLRRDRMDFPVDEPPRERIKFDRSIPSDWAPAPAPRDRWTHHDVRQRSRSPNRGGIPIKGDHNHNRREMYVERGREDRQGMNRDHHHHHNRI